MQERERKVKRTEPETTQTEPKTTQTEPKTTQTCQQIADLEHQTVAQLRARYLQIFGETTHSRHRQLLVRRIAWRLQALAEGNLSERARQRALSLAHDADLRVVPPASWRLRDAEAAAARQHRDPRLPAAGTVLRRQFRRRTIAVEILDEGFRHEGIVYPSLSAVAREITGTQWNGFLFFHLSGANKRTR
jgi:hypothetical protein